MGRRKKSVRKSGGKEMDKIEPRRVREEVRGKEPLEKRSFNLQIMTRSKSAKSVRMERDIQ